MPVIGMKRIIGTLSLLVLLCCPVGLATAAPTSSTATTRLQSLEGDILVELNRTRAEHGLRPLTRSEPLQGAAVFHSRAMLAGGFFEHDSKDGSPFSDRVRRFYPSAGAAEWSVGENLLFTTGTVGAAAVINAWLNSPGHRRNMLSPAWREVGSRSGQDAFGRRRLRWRPGARRDDGLRRQDGLEDDRPEGRATRAAVAVVSPLAVRPPTPHRYPGSRRRESRPDQTAWYWTVSGSIVVLIPRSHWITTPSGVISLTSPASPGAESALRNIAVEDDLGADRDAGSKTG